MQTSLKKTQQKPSTQFKKFYFKFQHKLPMIPHIEQQIKQFIQKHESNISGMSEQSCILLARAIKKKILKIEQFYDNNYVDYRAHMILRSRNLLHQFLIKNSEHLIPKQQQKDIVQLKPDQQNKKVNNDSTIENLYKKQIKTGQIQKNSAKKRIKTSVSKDYHSKKGQTVNEQNKDLRQSLGKYSAQKQKKPAKGYTSSRLPQNTVKSSFRSPNLIGSPQAKKMTDAHKYSVTMEANRADRTDRAQKVQKPQKKMSKQEYIRYLKKK